MSNLGVFGWIRESVRKSVLLGFSDAVEQLGVAADGDEPLNPQLAAVLRDRAPQAITTQATETASGKPKRKRLGRSLEQFRTDPKRPDSKRSDEAA